MAKVDVVCEEPVVPPLKEVVIRVSGSEARILLTLCGSVSARSGQSSREFAGYIHNELAKAGVRNLYGSYGTVTLGTL